GIWQPNPHCRMSALDQGSHQDPLTPLDPTTTQLAEVRRTDDSVRPDSWPEQGVADWMPNTSDDSGGVTVWSAQIINCPFADQALLLIDREGKPRWWFR
ncbi:MAG: hypothetical protein KDA85_04820, partial [Planctomycetaceae bacterium]|nr:hypothetical protein [Planctomycetaceae bacterium]